tara:strand:+ start:407 stop:565 length:159 start_codon:yes stop_codon:yes gene_type:complete
MATIQSHSMAPFNDSLVTVLNGAIPTLALLQLLVVIGKRIFCEPKKIPISQF